MGEIFDAVGCECRKDSNKIIKRYNSVNNINPVRVSDYSSSEMIFSTIIPREIYKDQPKNSFLLSKEQLMKKKNFTSREKIFEKYSKISILGKNNYSIVYKVNNKLSNKLQAMKKILKAKVENAEDTKHIINSISNLTNLNHDNLIKLYEFYEDEKYFYLITDLCEDISLDKIFIGRKTLCEFIIKFIMYRIFLALNYLHKQNIFHGDVKITNIGFYYKEKYRNNNNDIKISIKDLIDEICDDVELQEELLKENYYENLNFKAKKFILNLSKYEIKLLDCQSQEIFLKNLIDNENADILLNINYFSPELFDGIVVKERDEWACGILMFKLIKGYYPFDGDDRDELVDDIIKGNIGKEIDDLKVSDDCKDLIRKLLEKKHINRIKVGDCLKHNFFKNGAKFKSIKKVN